VRVLVDPIYEFSHLSDDKSQAIFQIDECADEYKPMLRQLLRRALQNRFTEAPQYYIQIHKDANDGPVPGALIDDENLQLTCDWRRIFTIFFSEEQLYHKLCGDGVKRQEEWVTGLRDKLERGYIDVVEMIEEAVKMFASTSDEARKMARRARIQKEFMEKNGTKWDAERDGDAEKEMEALKKLGQARWIASLAMDDDDEGTETEDGEEDEWEAEDESGPNDYECYEQLVLVRCVV
jgi:hypothetical protein